MKRFTCSAPATILCTPQRATRAVAARSASPGSGSPSPSRTSARRVTWKTGTGPRSPSRTANRPSTPATPARAPAAQPPTRSACRTPRGGRAAPPRPGPPRHGARPAPRAGAASPPAEGEDELEEEAVLGHAVAAVALAGRMDDAVAPAAHLVAHLLDVAVAAGGDHQGEGVGEGEVGGHAGVLARLQDLGLGEAVVAADGLVDEPVDLPPGPRRGAVGAADPLRPGLHRLALPWPRSTRLGV